MGDAEAWQQRTVCDGTAKGGRQAFGELNSRQSGPSTTEVPDVIAAALPCPHSECCYKCAPSLPCVPQAMSGPEDDAYKQVEKNAVAANSRMTLNSRFWSNLYVTQLRNKVAPGTFESRKVTQRE